jgi:predicted transcriptional regulator
MSVHPRFAALLFSGEKKFELRRRCAGLDAGDVVYVYATSPEMALWGCFVVDYVAYEPLSVLWTRVRSSAGVSKKQFDDYFQGRQRGFAISVRDQVLIKPVPIADLRKIWPGFHPPQSYRYLEMRELSQLRLLDVKTRKRLRVDGICEQVRLPL